MSTKENYIQSIRTARTHHAKWTHQIKLIVSGVSQQKDAVPVNQTDSDFSRWLFGEAMIFSTSSAKNVIDEMLDLHTQCYDTYLKIYRTLFSDQKNGILGMFGARKISPNDLRLAQNDYEELLKISDRLLGNLRVFESQMLATPETKFDELIIAPAAETEATPTAVAESASTLKQKIYFRGRVIEG